MLISLALAVLNSWLLIKINFQNEHILSQQYLRRINICDLGWKKNSSYYYTSYACVKKRNELKKKKPKFKPRKSKFEREKILDFAEKNSSRPIEESELPSWTLKKYEVLDIDVTMYSSFTHHSNTL